MRLRLHAKQSFPDHLLGNSTKSKCSKSYEPCSLKVFHNKISDNPYNLQSILQTYSFQESCQYLRGESTKWIWTNSYYITSVIKMSFLRIDFSLFLSTFFINWIINVQGSIMLKTTKWIIMSIIDLHGQCDVKLC